MSAYWWLKDDAPIRHIDFRNGRMESEIATMRALFNKDAPVELDTKVSWDVPFYVETLGLKLKWENEPLYWLCDFRMQVYRERTNFHNSNPWRLRVRYENHPWEEPSIFPYVWNSRRKDFVQLEGLGLGHHMFPDGHLCLWQHHTSAVHGWQSGKSTAATMAAWAVEWCRAELLAQRTGNFPTEA